MAKNIKNELKIALFKGEVRFWSGFKGGVGRRRLVQGGSFASKSGCGGTGGMVAREGKVGEEGGREDAASKGGTRGSGVRVIVEKT